MRGPTRILEILRDFLEVDRLVREVARRHRSQGLRFPELAALIRDDEGSVLFRLKERTHALFRGPGGVVRSPTHREALFDLAVGSLFHEAMKLRENLYQREVYGPRVRALHSDAEEESKALFDEFEKMLGAVDDRLDEGVRELETLSHRTADQLRLLIADLRDDGAVRFVTERPAEVEAVFGIPLDALLEEMYGSVARGIRERGALLPRERIVRCGARLLRARARAGRCRPRDRTPAQLRAGHERLSRARLRGVRASLSSWADSRTPEPELVPLARDAVSSIAALAEGDDRERISRDATALLERLGAGARAARQAATGVRRSLK